jgi:hypothetical protein
VLLLVAACAPDAPPHSCSGAAVDVRVGQVDAGVDAGFTGADGGRQAKPPCTAGCVTYRAALAEAINANVPRAACATLSNASVQCLPAAEPSSCPGNTLESARALEPDIARYLAAEWPELGLDAGPLPIDPCPCRIY